MTLKLKKNPKIQTNDVRIPLAPAVSNRLPMELACPMPVKNQEKKID